MSFREDNNSVHKSAQMTGHEYGSEFATSAAIAAATYAVHSLDQANTSNFTEGKTLAKERSRKGDDHLVPLPRSTSRTKETEPRNTRQGSMKKPFSEAPLAHKPSKISSSSLRSKFNTDAKIDTWEKNEIEKIKKMYAKIRSRIQSWEDDKKNKAKIKLQKKKIELECKKERNQRHYEFKIEKINGIGEKARAEMKTKMTREETVVQERAKKIRSGRMAAHFLCF